MTTLQNGTGVKKRGRPPKVKSEQDGTPSKQTKITDTLKKTKRTVDRFKGVTKEELMTRFLPDRIKEGLDILIIGINPGLFAAYKGHHYAGPGNHFWKCINMSGLVDRHLTSDNDIDLMEYGIGFSTIVQRTTPSAKDLSSKEIREGGKELIEKIKLYKPKIAVFNGKGIYEIFSKEMFGKKKKDFMFGKQAERIPDTHTFIFVMPSSSARCAQFPRAQDKVHYYIQIKRLRDEINGLKTDADVQETTYTFDLQKATEMAKVQKIKEERHDPSY
uniref:G/T mismatch-specific thymine DNA glycosylase n=2 Tax=Ciona savignyi TaxID=51511 RepID=H2YG24_CIOSA